MPDERTRALRRRLARRSQLVRARTRAKNECHAVLVRRLIKKPAVSDLFGLAGREWLREVALPIEERETVDGCLRQIEFLDGEIAEVEKQVARDALVWPQIKRLMTVPGVNAIVAATFLAAVGDISRFPSSRQLVGYLGLARRRPTAGSQSKARHRRGHALVEASWSVVRQPGPLHAFYHRIRAGRGHQVAVVAAARKLSRSAAPRQGATPGGRPTRSGTRSEHSHLPIREHSLVAGVTDGALACADRAAAPAPFLLLSWATGSRPGGRSSTGVRARQPSAADGRLSPKQASRVPRRSLCREGAEAHASNSEPQAERASVDRASSKRRTLMGCGRSAA
jgi:hypothetical protein